MDSAGLKVAATVSGHGRVLVVEDDLEDRNRLERLLRADGYQPVLTDQSDEAVPLATRLAPRLIILSADIPRGFNVCHALKKDKSLRRIPLILMTGRAGPEVIQKHRLLPTRADHYLGKPWSEEELRKAIVELMPEDFHPSAREVEIGEVPDRTLVGGGLESAVVTYVEEEVSSLKSRLNHKIQELETRLSEERARLDAALKALAEQQRAVVEAGQAEALREEGRREAREQARREIEGLKARIADLEAAEQAARNEAVAARAEADQNVVLFERLERGYKETISALEEEKRALESAISSLEAERDALLADREALQKATSDLPALREASARCELLQEELSKVAAERDELKARMESLTGEVETMKAAAARVAELEQANLELQASLQEARERLEAAEQARKAAEDSLHASQAELDEMRTMFQRLKAVLDSGLP